MPYIPYTSDDISRVLSAVGASSIDELIGRVIPPELRSKAPLDLPAGISEQELATRLSSLAARNIPAGELSSFLGAGAYHHYIPAVVDHLISRSEFYTSYTPYQPEASQGTLQAAFEYQTLVCQLTGMDVSNASLYDGASAVAEAALMARRITRRDAVVVSSAVHPEYRETLRTYLQASGESITEADFSAGSGTTTAAAVEAAMDDKPACVIVQHPNFFGCVEEVTSLADLVHSRGGLLVVVVTEPVSLGLLKPPGEMGADIVVGENQSFGNALNFGGPYLGFMATRDKYVRQMPGRLVGQTVGSAGKRAFCLTFATREQHIRRERATSNICTNQGLCALAAAVHMVSIGKTGMKKLARVNLSKAEYLKHRLVEAGAASPAFTTPGFNEFTIAIKGEPAAVLGHLLETGICGGLDLSRFYPELTRHLLVTATEMNTREDMDRFAEELARISKT